MVRYNLSKVEYLESESIYVFREVAAQFNNPVILFSGGKDSIVLVHLAKKAFFPTKIPLSILHIDTGHNFSETIKFRDELVKKNNLTLDVGFVQDSIDRKTAKEIKGENQNRNVLQSITLLEKLKEKKYDAAIGGGRRDEEKSRAKERIFSIRDNLGQWIPNHQRPELWNLYNGKKNTDESFRIFPLSNWTELDVWHYIAKEKIDVPSIYFSHKRNVVRRKNSLLPESPYIKLLDNEKYECQDVRFRTLGCMTISGAILSKAANVKEIIEEISKSRESERGNRVDDQESSNSMEDRKLMGYF